MAQKEKLRKKLKQKPISSEETVRALKVHESSPGGKRLCMRMHCISSRLLLQTKQDGRSVCRVGFVREVRFKPGEKERGTYG